MCPCCCWLYNCLLDNLTECHYNCPRFSSRTSINPRAEDMEEDDGGGSKKNPSLGSVLDGDEEPVLTIKESSPSDVETLVDGVPAAQAFR